MRRLFLLPLCLISIGLSAQVVINEVILGPTPQVELKNLGTEAQDASFLFLCSFPLYTQVGNMTILSGEMTIPPGGLLWLQGHDFNGVDDELGLYLLPDYDDPEDIIDYVEWGSPNHIRSGVAVAAGIWPTGDFVDGIDDNTSLEYDGDGDSSADWNPVVTDSGGEENSGTGCEASAILIGNQNVCEGECGQFQIVLSGSPPWTIDYSLNGAIQEPIVTSDALHTQIWCNEGQYSLIAVTDMDCTVDALGAANLDVQDPPTASFIDDGEICGGGPDSLAIELTGFAPWTIEFQEAGAPAGSITASSSPAFLPVGMQTTYTLTNVSDLFCDEGMLFDGTVDVVFNVVDGGELDALSVIDDTLTVCEEYDAPLNPSIDNTGAIGAQTQLIRTTTDSTILNIYPGFVLEWTTGTPGFYNLYSVASDASLSGLVEGNSLDDLSGCFDLSDPLVLEVEPVEICVTSLLEIDAADWQIFPNPTSETLFLTLDIPSSERMSYQIFDQSGRQVQNDRIDPQGQLPIDVSALSAGHYVLQLVQGESTLAHRNFVIQR